jgi:hypothetical protein
MIFFLKEKIVPPRNLIEMKLSLVNFQAPVGFYVVNEYNNVLTVNGVSYTLAVGNYDIEDVREALLSVLPANFTITYNAFNYKLTFQWTQEFTLSGSMLNLLGFVSNLTSSGGVLTADHLPDFSGINHIVFSIPNISMRNVDSRGSNSVLTYLPVNSAVGGTMFYTNFTNFKVNITTTTIDYINLLLLDEDRNPLDFANLNYSCVLQVDMTYSLDNSHRGITLEDVYRMYTAPVVAENKI